MRFLISLSFFRQGNGLEGDPQARARVRPRMLRRGLVKTKLLHKAWK